MFPTIRYVLQDRGVLLEGVQECLVRRYDGRGDVCEEFAERGFGGAAVRGPHEEDRARAVEDGFVVRVFESGYHGLEGVKVGAVGE